MKDFITGNDYVYIIFEHVQGDDICFEIVTRVSQGFVYSEAVARSDVLVNRIFHSFLFHFVVNKNFIECFFFFFTENSSNFFCRLV